MCLQLRKSPWIDWSALLFNIGARMRGKNPSRNHQPLLEKRGLTFRTSVAPCSAACSARSSCAATRRSWASSASTRRPAARRPLDLSSAPGPTTVGSSCRERTPSGRSCLSEKRRMDDASLDARLRLRRRTPPGRVTGFLARVFQHRSKIILSIRERALRTSADSKPSQTI